MSLNGSGVFVVNSTGQPVVAGTLISASVFNAFTADIATALSNAVYKDGQQTIAANLPMGGYKLTGLAAGTVAGDSVRYEQFASPPAIGGTSANTGTFTIGTFTDVTINNLTFSGSTRRLVGDFSNATISNRTMFQSSTLNSNSNIGIMPNGTATSAGFVGHGGSDPDNAQFAQIVCVGGTEVRLISSYSGTPASGTYLPITFYTGGSERVRIDTSGNVGIGVSPAFTNINKGIEIEAASSTAGIRIERTTTGAAAAELFTSSGTVNLYTVGGAYPLVFGVNNTEYMRLSGTGVPTYVTPPVITNANTVVSTVRTSSGNGYGSTNNKIRRFGTPDVNQGSDITYADSAANGATFTINTAGVYAISYTDSFTVSDNMGITLNSAQLTTAITSVTASTRLAQATVWNAAASALCSWTGPLAVNDVIRAHTGGSTQSSYTHFTITRIA